MKRRLKFYYQGQIGKTIMNFLSYYKSREKLTNDNGLL